MNLYDVVARLEDLPDHNLKRVGTLVEEWEAGVYEVEFADGITYALVALRANQLMTLYWHPTKQISY